MEVLQHFSHVHPLVFINEERSQQSEEIHCCACGESVSGPRFSCMECGFHLDKNCAEAPVKMNHPLHRKHNLNLLTSSPYGEGISINCNFCNNICEKFVYHCSCDLDLHLKCALLSFKIHEKSLRESRPQLVHQNPPVSSECHSQELAEVQCLACRKPLLDSDHYISPCSGFHLHKKCLELPLEINHLSHRYHSLILQFNSDCLPCQICKETQQQGLVYCCCSACKFVLHIECVSPPLVIEDPSSHEHPFTRCLRDSPFNCDVCGTSGNYVSYTCLTCSLVIHKKCISFPQFIKSLYHEHPICHKYFVVDNECTTQDCGICHEEVNMACGSYYCSKCKFIIHVNCALHDQCYQKISKDEFERAMLEADTMYPSFVVIKTIKVGENVINTEIKHLSHQHNLILSDQVKDQLMYCDCCSQFITASFYGCFDCDFSLHKSCAELPKRKKVIGRIHQDPHDLFSNYLFKCAGCNHHCSGFSYKCKVYLCNDFLCVRCAGFSWACISQAHKHMLLLYSRYGGVDCNACGGSTDGRSVYRCKACNFNVHWRCGIDLPQTAWDKFDRHCLLLTYHEDNDYSEYLYCDICERERSPNTWFYHCAICDNSAHLSCVLGDHPFIKRGIKIIEKDHPHTLVFVHKVYDYPDRCCKCGHHCSGLALECLDAECKYIIHWRCSTSFDLTENSKQIISLV